MREDGKIVDMFTTVFAIWDAKTKIEIECFKRAITEKMTFNHSELVDRFATYNKFNPSKHKQRINLGHVSIQERMGRLLRGTNSFQFEKLWSKLIADEASSIRVRVIGFRVCTIR